MLHRKVQCWIFSELPAGPLCLLLKTLDVRGGFYQPVTGSVEPGEGYFEAACRETFEETGFQFNSPPQDTAYEFDFTSRMGPTRERIFALVVDGAPDPVLDVREHNGFQWLTPQEAMKQLRYPSNIEGLQHCYLKVFGKDLK